MRHVIITGASRGIGKEMAIALASNEVTLHLTARSELDELKKELENKGANVRTYSFDLSETDRITELTKDIFGNIDFKDASGVALINNAGMLHPMGPIGKHSTSDYRKNLEVNFVAPVLLCQEFIQKTKDFSGMLRIVNVSSGAARKAYYGWSHYCATKAGLDRITEAVHLEHGDRIGCMGLNPGRTDTQMQTEIREQDEDDFQLKQSFVDAYESGQLNDPKMVAQKSVTVLFSERFSAGKTVPVNDLQ